MEKQKALVFRAIAKISKPDSQGSPTLKSYKQHTPKLNFDYKIALFETHAQAGKSNRTKSKQTRPVSDIFLNLDGSYPSVHGTSGLRSTKIGDGRPSLKHGVDMVSPREKALAA